MNFNSIALYISLFMSLVIGFLIMKVWFKNRKRSAESIYKLIDELEKKYIY